MGVAGHSSGDLLADRRFEYARAYAEAGEHAAAADLCAQRLFMPYQLPVGVVTVSLSGIYLIVLLVQESRKK